MSSLHLDLVALFEAASLGTYGTTLYVGSNAVIPKSATGPITSINPTGGTGGDRVQDTAGLAYANPSAQIVVRSPIGFKSAYDQARLLFDACAAVEDQLVNNTWYLWIRPLQSEPFDGGLDDQGRPTCKFNVLAKKRP